MAGFNFNMSGFNISNIIGNVDFNSMIPDIGDVKSKLPEGIRKMVPDIDIKSKVDINGKAKELINNALGGSNDEVGEAMNEAMNNFNAEGMVNDSVGDLNLEEYGLSTNELLSDLPSGISIG